MYAIAKEGCSATHLGIKASRLSERRAKSTPCLHSTMYFA
jgi:hypothetical protein